MNNTYYHIEAKNYSKVRKEAVLFENKYDAARCSDSLDYSHELDDQGEWVFVHKIKLIADKDLRIFDHTDPDDLNYLDGLADDHNVNLRLMRNVRLSQWSWRIFQQRAVKNRLLHDKFDGYTCRIAGYPCTVLFNSDKLKWLKMNRYEYTELEDEFNNRYR